LYSLQHESHFEVNHLRHLLDIGDLND
jgi:hypothetical protein